MDLALAHYHAHWARVTDMSARASYDLLCQAGARQLYVEVKGTTGSVPTVWLTPNEVALARAVYPHMALVVVTDIALSESGGLVQARDGTMTILEPWNIDQYALVPLAYEYRVDRLSGG